MSLQFRDYPDAAPDRAGVIIAMVAGAVPGLIVGSLGTLAWICLPALH